MDLRERDAGLRGLLGDGVVAGACAALLWLAWTPAAQASPGTCLPDPGPGPGRVYLCDSLEAGASCCGEVTGGAFTADGWRTAAFRDRIHYDLGVPVSAGHLSFWIRGLAVSESSLNNDNHHIIEMFDHGGHGSPDVSTYLAGVRVFGTLSDPAWVGKVKFFFGSRGTCSGDGEANLAHWDTSVWQADLWHHIEIEFGAGTATMRFDEADVASIDYGATCPLVLQHLYLPNNPWVEGAIDSVDGADYADVSFVGSSADPTCSAPDPAGIVVAEDHSVFSGEPDTHVADDRSLDVQGDAPGSPAEGAYLKFVVEPPVGHRVVSAIVHLVCGCPSGPAGAEGGGGSIYFVPDNGWSEATITWNNRPLPAGEALDTQGHIDPGLWYEFDVSAAVSAAGTYSFLLLTDDTNGGHYLSQEGGTATCEQPYLTIVTELDTGDDAGEPAPDGGAEDGSSPDAADTLDGPDGEAITDGGDVGRDVVAVDDSSLGCGCAVANAGAAARAGLAVLGGLLLVRLRRRRRSGG